MLKIGRSVRFLNASLSTPSGQQTLQDLADQSYDGDTDKAHAYLVFKLHRQVKAKHRDSQTLSGSDEENERKTAAKDNSGAVPTSSPATTAFVHELVSAMEEHTGSNGETQ